VNYRKDGEVGCRKATADEAAVVMRRDPDLQLQEITPPRTGSLNAQAAGLTIIVRGTSQLEGFPQAKQAFLRAVARWESLIRDPITIIVNVDFGPTNFGEPFPEGLVGNTHFQNTGDLSWYTPVREKLLAGAATPEERALYNSLPPSGVPTDLGDTIGVFGPSALFRAIGMLNPVADPEQETELGRLPSIGFNSAEPFDFDPSDGIDSDKTDFDALATHEIGHVLGCWSLVGTQERFPDLPPIVTPWDLFRFRPGITSALFPTAPRVLSSGGEQVFFAGGPELQLSTGRGDRTGGDGQQSHHWKANEFTGKYIGIMDPTFGDGERMEITENDLQLFDVMGYRIAGRDGSPVIRSLSASLNLDRLTLSGTASDAEGDVAQAQVNLLNEDGTIVAQTPPFPISVGTSPEVTFRLAINNLSLFPTAVEAVLTLIDGQGHRSKPLQASFNEPAPGGPVLSGVSLAGRKLKIKGNGLGGSVVVEINGAIIFEGTSLSSKKITLKGEPSALNLRSGPNRVRVRNGTLWSNIQIVTL
jgi:hypothetical protein